MMKNNKIKKITAVAVSVIMAAMMLSACGSGSPSKSADGKTIITVGDWPSKDGIEKEVTRRTQRRSLKRLIPT